MNAKPSETKRKQCKIAQLFILNRSEEPPSENEPIKPEQQTKHTSTTHKSEHTHIHTHQNREHFSFKNFKCTIRLSHTHFHTQLSQNFEVGPMQKENISKPIEIVQQFSEKYYEWIRTKRIRRRQGISMH